MASHCNTWWFQCNWWAILSWLAEINGIMQDTGFMIAYFIWAHDLNFNINLVDVTWWHAEGLQVSAKVPDGIRSKYLSQHCIWEPFPQGPNSMIHTVYLLACWSFDRGHYRPQWRGHMLQTEYTTFKRSIRERLEPVMGKEDKLVLSIPGIRAANLCPCDARHNEHKCSRV